MFNNLLQQFASKWRDLKAREDNLLEREEALKNRETALIEKEEKLKACEKELLLRQSTMGGATSVTNASNVISSVTSGVVAGRNVSAHQARRISMDRTTESMTIDEEHSDSTLSAATTHSSSDDLTQHYFKMSDQPAVVSQPYTYTSRVSAMPITSDASSNISTVTSATTSTATTVATTNIGIANRPPPYMPRQLPTSAPFTIYSDPVYTSTTANSTNVTSNDMPPPAAPRLYSRPVPPRPVPYTSHLGPTSTTTHTNNIVTGAEYSKENTHAIDINNFKQRNKDAVYAKVHANVNQGIDRLSANPNPSVGGAVNNAPVRRALGDLPVPPSYGNSVMEQFGSPLKKQRVQNAPNGYSALPSSTTVQVDLQTLLRKR